MATRIAPDAQEAIASARMIRMSPTKARQAVDLIRGRHVEDARRVLQFTPRAASPVVLKVLNSAVSNAEHNRGLTADELIVSRAWVDEGPTLRRFRPRAMGRATRVRKRICHISVVVTRAEEILADLQAPAQPRRTGTEEADEEAAPKKTTRKKSTAKKTAKKTTAKKTTAKKTTAKKTTAKKTAAKKTSAKKTTRKKKDS